jgi:hypothetical protein
MASMRSSVKAITGTLVETQFVSSKHVCKQASTHARTHTKTNMHACTHTHIWMHIHSHCILYSEVSYGVKKIQCLQSHPTILTSLQQTSSCPQNLKSVLDTSIWKSRGNKIKSARALNSFVFKIEFWEKWKCHWIRCIKAETDYFKWYNV